VVGVTFMILVLKVDINCFVLQSIKHHIFTSYVFVNIQLDDDTY